MTEPRNRNVAVGGNVVGSIIQTGDNARAGLTVHLPRPEEVDIGNRLAELRALLAGLETDASGKISRAFDDAEEEVSKSNPDKEEVASAVTRAVKLAQKAGDFSENVGKIRTLVTDIADWIGSGMPYIGPLLASVGLPAG